MMTALVLTLLLAPQEAPRKYNLNSLRIAVVAGDWETVAAIKRQVGSFKHPIWPNDYWDILSTFMYVTGQAGKYTNVLMGVRICIEYGADPNARGGGPLYLAAMADRYKKVTERLIEYGADPNGSKDGHRPLIGALQGFNRDTLEILLKHKADPNLRTTDKWWKTSGGKTRSILPLSFAAATGQTEAAEMLIKAGAKVNAKEPSTGETALHEAVVGGDKVNLEGTWSLARANDRAPVIKVLLKAGADQRIKDKRGRTALDLARAKNDKALIAALGG